jgi:hypothetical protein
MAKKKKASAKPTQEEPISLLQFGPIRYPKGDDPELKWNLAEALMHIHETMPTVQLTTKFVIGKSRIVFDRDDKHRENPERNDDGELKVSYRYLLKEWNAWGEVSFDPVAVKKMLDDRREDRLTPKARPMQMRGWSNHGAG